MFRTNSPTDSERSDELQLDRWLVIGIESSYTTIDDDDNLYSNRYSRQLYKYSGIYSNSGIIVRYNSKLTIYLFRTGSTVISERSDELQLDRRLDIGIEPNDANLNDDNYLHGNGHNRCMYRHSGSHGHS